MPSAQTTRIIPRLDIKGPNVVKGVRLEGLRVVGEPERAWEPSHGPTERHRGIHVEGRDASRSHLHDAIAEAPTGQQQRAHDAGLVGQLPDHPGSLRPARRPSWAAATIASVTAP